MSFAPLSRWANVLIIPLMNMGQKVLPIWEAADKDAILKPLLVCPCKSLGSRYNYNALAQELTRKVFFVKLARPITRQLNI